MGSAPHNCQQALVLSTGGWCPPDSPWGQARSAFRVTLCSLPSGKSCQPCGRCSDRGTSGCQGWEGKCTTDVWLTEARDAAKHATAHRPPQTRLSGPTSTVLGRETLLLVRGSWAHLAHSPVGWAPEVVSVLCLGLHRGHLVHLSLFSRSSK